MRYIAASRSPTLDSSVTGSLQLCVGSRIPIRFCDVITTNRRAWPFVVYTRSRHRLPDIESSVKDYQSSRAAAAIYLRKPTSRLNIID